MSNPFGDPDDEDNGGEILEGFLCPICRKDLKSLEFLAQHFEREHSEEQDALKSIFKDIFTKAKNKIKQNFDDSFERNFDKNLSISGGGGAGGASGGAGQAAGGSNGGSGGGVVRSNARSRMNVFNFMDRQEMGAERSHLEYFQSVRNPRLERYASETNKLIIRLHRLLKDMPTDAGLRKQHERNTVAWLDGSSVKLCPSCAKSFHLARRQHHCRLCGSIMCNDCSQFLPFDTGYELASLTLSQAADSKANSRVEKNPDANSPQQNTLRICSHCLWLLETRQQMHESRTSRPPITQLYSDIQQLRKDVLPDIDMYLKIIQSLYEGESIFTIGDASALRGKIGHFAELIDVRSKRVLALPCQEGSREESLKKAVRLSCIQMIKEKIMSLPPLPDEEEIRKVQERKRMEAEQRIATERRQAMEAYERYGLGQNENSPVGGSSRVGGSTAGTYAQGSDLQSLDHWSAHQVSSGISGSDDPLVEQINIIKGYIKQARQEMNFDVVMTLELNLRELQREFYERQRNSTMPTMNSAGGE